MEIEAKVHDLTRGPIFKKILVVALPIIGTQLVQMSYNLMDVFWMGKIGSQAVAASATSGLFMWMAYGLVMLGRVGAEIGVSQNMGRGDKQTAQTYAQNALYIAAFFGIVYSLAMIVFRYPLVGFFKIPDEKVSEDARIYLVIVSIGLPFDFLYNVIVGIFNASGNSKTPFVISTVGLVSNLIMDPLMIFAMDMGIVGAALSTSLAQVATGIWIFVVLKKGKDRPFESFTFFHKPDFAAIRQIFKWSAPVSVENMLFTGMAMITSRFTAAYGASAMAASRIGSQIESLSWLIGGGFGTAMTSFIGQNFGAEKWRRIRNGMQIAARVMLVWGVFITVFIYFGAGMLFSVFLSEPTELALGTTYLHILAWCQLAQCFEAVSQSAFKGTGNTLPPTLVSVVCNAGRVLLAYTLSKTSLGLYGIWAAISIAGTVRGVWLSGWCLKLFRKAPTGDKEVAAVHG